MIMPIISFTGREFDSHRVHWKGFKMKIKNFYTISCDHCGYETDIYGSTEPIKEIIKILDELHGCKKYSEFHDLGLV